MKVARPASVPWRPEHRDGSPTQPAEYDVQVALRRRTRWRRRHPSGSRADLGADPRTLAPEGGPGWCFEGSSYPSTIDVGSAAADDNWAPPSHRTDADGRVAR